MSECEKAKIVGYVEQTPEQIKCINCLKEMELTALAELKTVSELQPHDKRWLAIARTHIQEGFMAAVRAIARPNGD